ncbi:formate hydrogenlyase complex iron-sulfur subunit [Campylobacter gastrosuis]|uniref:Formate hydrogenlyase complex iron-sulfur subunit n=1 Tax=Campylobacter gastrosuis TaxID=2974576 RepID=A0ABT7HRH6_9BACT|nr:formate hydrogenlyase complex iron-sulfur subunit [Campylobacter gastrosuis]MDL0089018.1 formate hydrogenlyase complex iron-sulfur subunit [Campylobacter gastrosuis]
MMRIFDINKKYGVATHEYPFKPYPVSNNFRGRPKYKFSLCIGCASCGVACPPNAISVKFNDDKSKLVWEFNAGRCIFCGRCDEVCPTGAIRLSDEFELAVRFNKDDLIQRGELEPELCTSCGKPFSTKRLVKHGFDRLKLAGLNEARLEQAKIYMKICPECKQQNAIKNITTGQEMEIK